MPKLALIGLFALATAGASPHVIARIETGSSSGGAVSAFGAVWVANDRSGTRASIPRQTG